MRFGITAETQRATNWQFHVVKAGSNMCVFRIRKQISTTSLELQKMNVRQLVMPRNRKQHLTRDVPRRCQIENFARTDTTQQGTGAILTNLQCDAAKF
jgi:hypothetical protein